MSADVDTFDDIDESIERKLEELHKIERAPVGLKARVIRHYDRIRHANKILGWSYARIASDVLRPAGMLISPTTLRIYMEDIAKRQGETPKTRRNLPPMRSKRTKKVAPDHVSDTPAPHADHQVEVPLQSPQDGTVIEDVDVGVRPRSNEEPAGLRRARART